MFLFQNRLFLIHSDIPYFVVDTMIEWGALSLKEYIIYEFSSMIILSKIDL